MKINNISAWLRTLAERGFSARAVIEQPQDRNLERENRAYCQEYQRSKALFMRVDRLVKKEALYKDSELTLNKLAAIVGTNRTYLSRAFSVSGENFRDYLFHLRMQELEKLPGTSPGKESEQRGEKGACWVEGGGAGWGRAWGERLNSVKPGPSS